MTRRAPPIAPMLHEAGRGAPLVPDAAFAALALAGGCEWVATDRDFARFKGRRWRYPLG
jgi:uncharacterized protein